MTDSVRCSADSPQSFTCEVQIESDPETLTCEAPPPEPPVPPPAANPAVSSLVKTYVSKTVVPAPPAPLLSRAALLSCAASEAAVLLAAASAKGPVLGALTMLKASLDASHCLTLARNDAAQRNAEDYCKAQGGTVVGVEGNKTICEVRQKAK